MNLITLVKAKVTIAGMGKARKVAETVKFGPRAGRDPKVTRELVARIAFAMTVPGKAVEVTDIAQEIASGLDGAHSGHYHLIWTRCATNEDKVGAKCRVVMFTQVTSETTTSITGVTKTTAPGATGRVFIIVE